MAEAGGRLLVVGDEATNRDLIGEYLQASGYQLDYASDAREAWKRLDAEPAGFDAVLLDRMMPGMNGIELLRHIKADARPAAIPVVMQTAAADSGQIAEGMRLGAYYYLTKPYGRQALLAVTATALADSRQLRALRADLSRAQHVLHLLTEAQFRFRGLGEARLLAAELANRAAVPERVVIGLSELLVNAVEHGCLRLGYDDKSRLLAEGHWQDEIERRLQAAEFAGCWVDVLCRFRQGQAEVVIRDPGAGFDWQEYLEMRPARAFDQHGRGIALARQLAFSSLAYEGNGNTVRVAFPLR